MRLFERSSSRWEEARRVWKPFRVLPPFSELFLVRCHCDLEQEPRCALRFGVEGRIWEFAHAARQFASRKGQGMGRVSMISQAPLPLLSIGE